MTKLLTVLGLFIGASLIAAAACGGGGGATPSAVPTQPSATAQASGTPAPGILSVGNAVTVIPADREDDPTLLAALALTPEQVGNGATVTKAEYTPDGASFTVMMHSPEEDVMVQVVRFQESDFPASLRSFLGQLDQLYGDVVPTKPPIGDEGYVAVGRPIGAKPVTSVVAVTQSGLYMSVVSVTGSTGTAARAEQLLTQAAANVADFRLHQHRAPVPPYAPSPPS